MSEKTGGHISAKFWTFENNLFRREFLSAMVLICKADEAKTLRIIQMWRQLRQMNRNTTVGKSRAKTCSKREIKCKMTRACNFKVRRQQFDFEICRCYPCRKRVSSQKMRIRIYEQCAAELNVKKSVRESIVLKNETYMNMYWHSDSQNFYNFSYVSATKIDRPGFCCCLAGESAPCHFAGGISS